MPSPNRILYTPRERKKATSPLQKNAGRLFPYFLVTAAMIGGLWYAVHLPRLRLNNIAVAGAEALDAEVIRERVARFLVGDYAGFIPRDTTLFIGGNAIVSRLKKDFPGIKEAKVRRGAWGTLLVELEERMPWGIWCDGLTPEEERETKSDNQGGEKCAYIDDEGFAYEEAPSSSGALVVKIRSDTPGVPVGSAAADPLLMRDMRFFGKEIASVTGSSFVEYRFFSHLPRQLELVSSEGFTLMVSREGDLANTLRVLKKVLEEEIKDQRSRLEYIDLRLGSKVFYKFK